MVNAFISHIFTQLIKFVLQFAFTEMSEITRKILRNKINIIRSKKTPYR